MGRRGGGGSSLDPLLLRLSQVWVNACRCHAHRCEGRVGGLGRERRKGRGKGGGRGREIKKQGWKGRVGAQASGVYAFRSISLLLYLRSTSTMKTCTNGFMHISGMHNALFVLLEFGKCPEPDCCHW